MSRLECNLVGIKPGALGAWLTLGDVLKRMEDRGRQSICARRPDDWSADSRWRPARGERRRCDVTDVHIDYPGQGLALVQGYGTRELLTGLSDRPPVCEELSQAWVTTTDHARSLIELLGAAEESPKSTESLAFLGEGGRSTPDRRRVFGPDEAQGTEKK